MRADMMSISKVELLRSLGYGGEPARAFEVLDTAGLSRRTKAGIHPGKLDAVRAILGKEFVFHCGRGDCLDVANAEADGRIVVIASRPEHCIACGGSSVATAIAEMCRECQAAGWNRICIVGGSPSARDQLNTSVGHSLSLRLIDGIGARKRKQANVDIAWADHVVIWAGTQLNHSASEPYHGVKVSQVNRRGIRSLAQHIAERAVAHQTRSGGSK